MTKPFLKTLILIWLYSRIGLAGNPAKTIGFYDWGGQYPASMSSGVEAITALGSRVARISVSPRYSIDYNQSSECSTVGSLRELVKQTDVKAALDNPNIDVFMLTAYDFTTFGDCQTQLYLTPQFYTPENIQLLVREYSDLTLYLYEAYAHTYKRFIISNWEGDNSIYCGQAYAYATSQPFRTYCDGSYSLLYYGNSTPADSFTAMRLWFQYRQQGIADGRARAAKLGLGGMRAYFAPEVCDVRALHDNGLPSLLYDVLPHVIFDYVSYSAYESINAPDFADRLIADLNTIQAVTGSGAIILGEIGFARSTWGAVAISRTADVLASADRWGVSFLFVWNLYDSSNTDDFGAYGSDGQLTDLGRYYQSLLAGPPQVFPAYKLK